MEGDFIKIKEWLLPFSWIYGCVVSVRNYLFDWGILKSQSFNTPVISVGNITVGGSGKTPHVEYLIRLLKQQMKVAVLSRGYKRKSRGYVLAGKDTQMNDIGDEPFQMFKKNPDVYVAVDKNRCRGINRLCSDEATNDTDVVLLDDAYQHRYVKPGINILLVDYHRLIIYDKLLPAGRLREPKQEKNRADIVIVTKCPDNLTPMSFRVLTRAMSLYPFQKLYFSKLKYGKLKPAYCGNDRPLESLQAEENVLLLTGIASPQQMILDIKPFTERITPLTFRDHHMFNKRDVRKINETFAAMPEPKLIITTEKDNTRLFGLEGLSEEVRHNLYILPVEIEFLLGQQEDFNEKITGYVFKNSKNSILVKRKDDDKSKDSHHSGHRSGTISFRNS